MSIRLGVVMDPIASIKPKKDSTLAMLWEADRRGWEIHYFTLNDLFLRDGVPYGDAQILKTFRDEKNWFALDSPKTLALSALDVILMRKDPPFNEEYIYSTYILEHAEALGVLVLNRPQALRDANEKFFVTWFPTCSVPSLVTRSIRKIKAFWQEHGEIVCKPLYGMGGVSVFRIPPTELNANVIFETLTDNETRFVMAQQFIPEIKRGDKRILLINGEPFEYALVRIPQESDWRGNLAVGAIGEAHKLTERDLWICAQLKPTLQERGLYFVGLDVIGDYLTEVNVTSPTGIRELDNALGSNICAKLMDFIESNLNSR